MAVMNVNMRKGNKIFYLLALRAGIQTGWPGFPVYRFLPGSLFFRNVDLLPSMALDSANPWQNDVALAK
uniref:Uncharacterized protein n=1 Tax=Candidatus Kentrum sp. MB TaxID=2138164 RepID=A0A450X3V3_9GAMM|nr:MAG: hypothetical protein BECKMB1821G_GA0114241_100657 [Candidatus Kentron sp. MB]